MIVIAPPWLASSSGRAQRASARGLSHNGALALNDDALALDPLAENDLYNGVDPDSAGMALDENGETPSRSTSAPLGGDGVAHPVNGRNGKPTRDKGKGKERERGTQEKHNSRVKEEPVAFPITDASGATVRLSSFQANITPFTDV